MSVAIALKSYSGHMVCRIPRPRARGAPGMNYAGARTGGNSRGSKGDGDDLAFGERRVGAPGEVPVAGGGGVVEGILEVAGGHRRPRVGRVETGGGRGE